MRSAATRHLTRWVCAVFATVLVAVLGVAVWIASYDARFAVAGNVDAVIVLGAAVYGGRPSPVFAGRLDYAIDLLRARRARYVVVTGGGRDDPSHPESIVGAHYIRSQGIGPARVLLETRSIDTLRNLCFAAEVGAAHQLHSYAIVSDPLHMRRAMQLAHDIALSAVPAATPHTRYRSLRKRFAFLVRETLLVAKRLVLGVRRCTPHP